MVKRICSLFTVALMAMMTFACTAFAADGPTDISDGYVYAEGVGDPNQSYAMGMRAAKLLAARELLEEINGMWIDGDSTVEQALTKSDVVKSKVSGLVQRAKVYKQFQDEHGYHVILRMPVYGGSSSLAAMVLPEVEKKVAFPEPEKPIPVTIVNPELVPDIAQQSGTYRATGRYTGVIVDCRGLDIDTAMAPAVFTMERKVIYRYENFSRQDVLSKGYVGYASSMSVGVERAGSNPLVVKAKDVERFCNPVIEDADADVIMAENKVSGFLGKGAMVFVRD